MVIFNSYVKLPEGTFFKEGTPCICASKPGTGHGDPGQKAAMGSGHRMPWES